MAFLDLELEQIRRSKLQMLRERLRRMRRQRKKRATHDDLPSNIPESPRTSTTGNIPEASDTTQQQTMDVELLEATKVGDVENFIECFEKFSRKQKIPMATIFSQVTSPERDTFLHVAASYGHEELCALIAHHFRNLITCKNHKGDSALHLAARGGHLGVVKIILDYWNTSPDHDSDSGDSSILTDEERMAIDKRRLEERVAVNDEGNTALHEALLNNHNSVAEYLIKWNVEAAYYVNKQGKSPLYIAVEAGNSECVNDILNERSVYMHLLDEQLTKGKSLLHAAIMGLLKSSD